MSTILAGDQMRSLVLGVQVNKAAAILPATTVQTLFTISGGRILVTALIGEVTTVFDGTANSLSVEADPTVGAAADLAAATVCTSDIAGTLYTVNGIQAALLGTQKEGGTEVPTHATAHVGVGGTGFVVPAGVIQLRTTATDTTGATKWTLMYVPLDTGASAVSG
jgi:hypothetical protein